VATSSGGGRRIGVSSLPWAAGAIIGRALIRGSALVPSWPDRQIASDVVDRPPVSVETSRRRSTIRCGATRTPRLHRNECRLPAAAPSIGPIAVMIRARVIRPHQRRPSVRGADCEHIRVTTRAYRLVCGEYTGALSGCPTRDFRKMQHPTFQPPPGASAEVAVFPANHAGVACSAYRQTLAQLGAGTRSVGVRVPGLCEAEGRSLTPDRKSVVKSSRPD
jgi:hypothetical protein